MRNIELLERVADQIENDPEHWRQEYFWNDEPECGTTYCIGGWAAVLSGLDPTGLISDEMGAMLGLTRDEIDLVFFQGMDWDKHPMAHKETAEWLRGIARGDDVRETAPEWWIDD